MLKLHENGLSCIYILFPYMNSKVHVPSELHLGWLPNTKRIDTNNMSNRSPEASGPKMSYILLARVRARVGSTRLCVFFFLIPTSSYRLALWV